MALSPQSLSFLVKGVFPVQVTSNPSRLTNLLRGSMTDVTYSLYNRFPKQWLLLSIYIIEVFPIKGPTHILYSFLGVF